MDALVYFTGATKHGLDELEDAVDEALSGIGEVSGTGSGLAGSNLDISLYGNLESNRELVDLIRESQSRFDLPQDSSISVGDQSYPLYP